MDGSTRSAKSAASTCSSQLSSFSASSRRSIKDMFFNAKKSFMRSGGERGASVQILRGKHGADFEGVATIRCGESFCSCSNGIFGSSKKKKEKYILIKGSYCFIYNSYQSLSPHYSIGLAHIKPVMKKQFVLLHSCLGDTEFEFKFQNDSNAKYFSEVVKKNAYIAETEEIRKKLGHEHLLKKSQSIHFAESVGMKKLSEQPSNRSINIHYAMDTITYAM